MARKRGAPVLIELMNTGAEAPSADAAPQLRLAPMEQIEAKPNGQTGQTLLGGMAMPPRSGKGSPLLGVNWLSQLGKIPPMMWYVATAVIVLLAAAFYFGFNSGQAGKNIKDQQQREKELGAVQVAPPIPQTNPGTGTAQQPLVSPAPGVANPVPEPDRPAGPAVIPTVPTPSASEPDAQLQTGLNYLICGVFKRQEDADKSAAYLVSKGLPAAIVPAKEFSSSASAKDLMVLIKRGYTRDKYSSSGLREKVQGLGRLWRAEDKRAPTDFAQPYWDKFK